MIEEGGIDGSVPVIAVRQGIPAYAGPPIDWPPGWKLYVA